MMRRSHHWSLMCMDGYSLAHRRVSIFYFPTAPSITFHGSKAFHTTRLPLFPSNTIHVSKAYMDVHMYVCMYVFMYVCMYVCMYVSMYVCMHCFVDSPEPFFFLVLFYCIKVFQFILISCCFQTRISYFND